MLLLTLLGADAQPRFMVDIGLIGRKTIGYEKNIGASSGPLLNWDAPYHYKEGVNGFGLNVTPSITLYRKMDLLFHAGTTVRYDFYKWGSETIYFDVNAGISTRVVGSIYAGFGATAYNLGKKLHYVGFFGDNQVLNLQFNSLDLFAGIMLGKVGFEPKLCIVQQDFPGRHKDNATLLSLRLFYRWSVR